MSEPPRRVIIDTDPSAGVPGADVDDVLALAWALGCPDLAVEGVTVVAGNVELAEAVPSALQTVEILGRADVPVHAGAARPLVRERGEITAFLRARRDDPLAHALWRDVPPPATKPAPQPGRAAEFTLLRAGHLHDRPQDLSRTPTGARPGPRPDARSPSRQDSLPGAGSCRLASPSGPRPAPLPPLARRLPMEYRR